MLSGLRRLIDSTVGKVLALIILVLIALAFAAGDVSGWLKGGSSGGGNDSYVATVNHKEISDSTIITQTRSRLTGIQQQNPGVTMQQAVAAGLLDQIINDVINGRAIAAFAEKIGMHVSGKQVDAEIASIPAFQGLDGKFDQKTYDQRLASLQMTTADLRADVKRSLLAQMLIEPVSGAKQVPQGLALPYASSLLEQRKGEALFIPIQAFGPGKAPTDQEVEKFYKSHAAKYMIPERRVIRYAMIDPSSIANPSPPTDAEVEAAYKAAGNRYAPTENRTIEQIIVMSQSMANQLAEKVKKGQSMSAVAKAAGLEARTISDTTQKGYADQAGTTVASAAFSAKQGDVLVPGKTPLGWAVIKVTAINNVPGKTLAQARPELVKEIDQQKTAQALNDLQNRIDDGITAGSTFNQLVTDNKLQAQETVPLTSEGVDVDKPQEKPDDTATTLAKAGFDMQPTDQPQLVPVGKQGAFALIALAKVVPGGPPPLTKIRKQVEVDFRIDRALEQARSTAADIVKKVSAGESLNKAAAATKLRIPPPRAFSVKRLDFARLPEQQIPTPIRLLFTMKPKTAKLSKMEQQNAAGYFVVYLDDIMPGNAKGDKELIDNMGKALGGVIGNEFTEQYINAIKTDIEVKKNAEGIKKVRDQLSGGGAPDQGN